MLQHASTSCAVSMMPDEAGRIVLAGASVWPEGTCDIQQSVSSLSGAVPNLSEQG